MQLFLNNPNYRICIKRGNEPGIVAPAPENFSINLSMDWSPQFANSVQDVATKLGGAKAQYATQAMSAAGYQPLIKKMTALIWGGTSHMDLTLPFVFRVHTNADTELVKPMQQILKYALPSIGAAGLMKAPYSVLDSNNSTKMEPLQVYIGRFFMLPECVITNVSQQYDCIFDKDGRPLSAKIDLTVRSYYAITVEDIPTMFKGA